MQPSPSDETLRSGARLFERQKLLEEQFPNGVVMSSCPACGRNTSDDSRYCGGCGRSLGDACPPSGLIGRVIAERYRVLRVIAEGGMGVVYEAEQSMGERVRSVALKTLLPELSHDQVVVARFTRECAVVASLEHPNTVRVYDFGKTSEGILYIAMEYVRGRPLGDLIAEGPIALSRCLGIVDQIASALDEAHQLGVVHRDLKPDNVILSERATGHDFVKLLDFGIAKRSSHGGRLDTKLTAQGMMLGTPPYMAPEQFGDKALDRSCDIYALGVIVYEMLNGRLPFEADTPWQWAHHHLSSAPAPFRAAVPKAVERAVLAALNKDPVERPASSVDFYRQLLSAARDAEPLVAGAPVRTEPSLAGEPTAVRTADEPRLEPSGNTEPGDGFRGSGPAGVAPGDTEPGAGALASPQRQGAYLSTAPEDPRRAPEGRAVRPASPSPVQGRRRAGRALRWILALGVVSGGLAVLAWALNWGAYFDDPMPPMPRIGQSSAFDEPVVIAIEPAPAYGGGVKAPYHLAQPTTASGGHVAGNAGSETAGTGGATSVVTGWGTSSTSVTTSTSVATSTVANPLGLPISLPVPITIPTGIFPIPFSQGTAPAPAPTAASAVSSCAQATALATSNLDGAVDQYLSCEKSLGAQAAAPTRRVLVLQGWRRVVALAKQGQCSEAQAVIATMSRIGSNAQGAIKGTPCAAP